MLRRILYEVLIIYDATAVLNTRMSNIKLVTFEHNSWIRR